MNWLDVCGPPGTGKSTLCYPVWGDKSVTWDGQLPPAYWKPFLDEITTLMQLVKDHVNQQTGRQTIGDVMRMCDRSAKKMATVERMPQELVCIGAAMGNDFTQAQKLGPLRYKERVFVQTGLVQRILGFGWRLQELGRDINLIRRALWLMPVSVGVAFLEADLETILARNRDREKAAATAHENRSHQVALMLPSIALAKQVLRERGIPVAVIDVQHQPIEDARAQLLAFADQAPCDAAQMGSCAEGPLVRIPPPWWRS